MVRVGNPRASSALRAACRGDVRVAVFAFAAADAATEALALAAAFALLATFADFAPALALAKAHLTFNRTNKKVVPRSQV